MPLVQSREQRSRLDTVNADSQVAIKTTTYTMKAYETTILASTAAGAWTLTLPPVEEAAGRMYVIRLTATNNDGAAPNTLTVSGTKSRKWHGSISLRRAGEVAVLASDGEQWHLFRRDIGQPAIDERHFHEFFNHPFAIANANAGGIPVGTAGSINMLTLSNGNALCYIPNGTQTLLGPIWVNPGLNVACDLTDNDGLEITPGIGSAQRHRFTIGTDAMFVKLRFTIADVSGTDNCAVGFRIRAAHQANIDDYTDMAVLNVISGDIFVETILNNAATTSTDTTNNWADAETHELAVFVSKAGVASYTIDGSAPVTVPATFTFDSGDEVIPFFWFVHATTSPGAITLLEWEWGVQN